MKISLKEPKGTRYTELIKLAFEICDQFVFIKHSQLYYNKSINELIARLQDSFICSRIQNEWPGTISVPTAEVYYFNTTKEAEKIILGASESMYQWCAPHLPDDLSFLKFHQPWLVCTSHERYCFIDTEEKKEIEQIQLIEKIAVN